ncbi:cysteine desulfurase [Novosphingobium flavum]|uniref:Cysteine desulfurase n=1 Tax=Novosphingobium flavum TaxID=1778672 RepID=A0A7X1KKX8_9SPHN|nr:cysteine desulfurase family protein [Novosphingobium flavum]MBC2665024.1 cysteine desulfurase [Novosphingobium flavum]
MIYLDYQATTPLAPEAREAMMTWLAGPESSGFANPHSPHRPGRIAAAAIEIARDQVAALFPPGGRVIFTSGATEALNLAIVGSGAKAIAASAIEHSAVIETAQYAADAFSIVPVDGEGLVDPAVALPDRFDLLAVMHVNNEIGTVQPINQLAARAKEKGALMLCDAVQGAGKFAPPEGADLIAATAHKIYGPKGIGCLWVRDGVDLKPIMRGGGQEGGLRSGTLSPALCVGFGIAARLMVERRERDTAQADELFAAACAALPGFVLNGSAEKRWRGNLNLRREGLDVARLMSDLRDIAFSAGSACASGKGKPSRVLSALGLNDKQARTSIRLGFGRYSRMDEVVGACERIAAAAAQQ